MLRRTPCVQRGPVHRRAVVAGLPGLVDAVFVVDDGSTDDTAAAAACTSTTRASSSCSHERNRGVGGAMVAGLPARARGGLRRRRQDGRRRADGLSASSRPCCAHPQLGMADYAKGNRFRRTGRPRRHAAARWFGNVVLSFLTKVASGYWHVFDPQCGFTAITAAALAQLKLDGLAHGLLLRERHAHSPQRHRRSRRRRQHCGALRGRDVSGCASAGSAGPSPCACCARSPGASSSGTWSTTSGHRRARVPRPLVFLFGLVFGVYHWIESAATGEPATAGTVMIAVVPHRPGLPDAASGPCAGSPVVAWRRGDARVRTARG